MRVRVVGSGPAGLMAADVLSAAGFSVTIVDHHRQPARKFLLAGRGGLNLTHAEPLDAFLDRYGPDRAFLEPTIRAFPPDALRQWCGELGVQSFVGSTGRIFPVGLKASPLLRALMLRLAARGVVREGGHTWAGFDDVPTLLAMGGASWPELGSDGQWQTVFREAGIDVVSFKASNVRQPMAWQESFAARFKGLPLKNVAVGVGAAVARGELMIAEDGLEGGALYALSRALRMQPDAPFYIDLKPDVSAEVIAAKQAVRKSKESESNFLRKAFNLTPQAIGLMREAGTRDPKHVVLPRGGEPSVRRAISTAGGVARHEVDGGFRLFKKPNVWVAGEMLDWDAPTGGYLLQACFSTSRMAALNMVETLR